MAESAEKLIIDQLLVKKDELRVNQDVETSLLRAQLKKKLVHDNIQMQTLQKLRNKQDSEKTCNDFRRLN